MRGFSSEKSRFLISSRGAPDISPKVYSLYSKINEFAVAGARSSTTNLHDNLLRYSFQCHHFSPRRIGRGLEQAPPSGPPTTNPRKLSVPREWPTVAVPPGPAHFAFLDIRLLCVYIFFSFHFFPLFSFCSLFFLSPRG